MGFVDDDVEDAAAAAARIDAAVAVRERAAHVEVLEGVERGNDHCVGRRRRRQVRAELASRRGRVHHQQLTVGHLGRGQLRHVRRDERAVRHQQHNKADVDLQALRKRDWIHRLPQLAVAGAPSNEHVVVAAEKSVGHVDLVGSRRRVVAVQHATECVERRRRHSDGAVGGVDVRIKLPLQLATACAQVAKPNATGTRKRLHAEHRLRAHRRHIVVARRHSVALRRRRVALPRHHLAVTSL